MNKFLILVLVLFAASAGFFIFWRVQDGQILVKPRKEQIQKERSLDKYTIEAFLKTQFGASQIVLGRVLEDRVDSTSYVFYFDLNRAINRGLRGKVSGLVNIPKVAGEYPVVVMFRGYVDREIYATGVGTQRAGEVFAQNGFITLAPDFLGYGESDDPSENAIEERFQTYVTALTLLESVKNLNNALIANNILIRADSEKVGIWGHSNGGQIALTVLEITGRPIPTVLWAPVSKPFPYSVLYYTDESRDRGKMLRRVIAEFERDYDVEEFNLTNFFDKINAPLQIHQGTLDEFVPLKWSNQLVEELEKLGRDAQYFTYMGADHNLLPGGWNLAARRAMDFWREKFLVF
ncbi:alpha/beta fold hydrolase [Candidatus Curtissbacteria bacterium]|nr:alpha/beta fold hydrolase [Candidatus Curtissbacteria bacterium]